MLNQQFVCFVLVILLAQPVSDALGIHTIEKEICTDLNSQINPDYTMIFIVWQDNRNGDWDIYAYDMDKQTEYAICTAEGNQTNPTIEYGLSIDDLIIAWQDDRNGNNDIYGYKIPRGELALELGSEIAICTDPCDQQNPAAWGSYVCWQDNRNGDWDIYGKIYEHGEEPNDLIICDREGDQVNANICHCMGILFIWQDNRNGNWDIYGCHLEDQNELTICTEDGNQVNPSGGPYGFSWQDDRNGNNDIYASFCTYVFCSERFDVDVCTDSNSQMYPSNRQEIVAWQDNRNGDWDIYGYKMLNYYTGTEFVISAGAGDQIKPVTDYYNWLVWQDNRNGNDDIYAGYLCLSGNDDCNECAIELFNDQPYFGSTEGMNPTYWDHDEPPITSSCGFNDFIDVWHVYKPVTGGPITITTEGSAIDTILSAFNSCYEDSPSAPDTQQEPIELACNDDYCLENVGSKVTLDAVGGKSYYIRVSGFNDQSGDYKIVVKRGAATDPIKSDLNGDGKVNWSDFAIFASEWLMPDSQ